MSTELIIFGVIFLICGFLSGTLAAKWDISGWRMAALVSCGYWGHWAAKAFMDGLK